jgi:hypothetical protein
MLSITQINVKNASCQAKSGPALLFYTRQTNAFSSLYSLGLLSINQNNSYNISEPVTNGSVSL